MLDPCWILRQSQLKNLFQDLVIRSFCFWIFLREVGLFEFFFDMIFYWLYFAIYFSLLKLVLIKGGVECNSLFLDFYLVLEDCFQ